jgi:hypothetical protein
MTSSDLWSDGKEQTDPCTLDACGAAARLRPTHQLRR